MSSTVTIVTNENRARNIAIGFAVITILTWWQVTGSLPLLAASMLPDNSDGKVSSVQAFLFELIVDGLYLVGAFATAIISGIWSLGVSAIQMLIAKTQTTKQIPESDFEKSLDSRTDQILQAIEKHLNDFDERIEKLEMVPDVLPKIAPKRRTPGARS